MREPIDVQAIVGRDGKPEYFIVPAQLFERIRPVVEAELSRDLIPHEVVGKNALEDMTMVRAWREHLGLTQAEVAKRCGMSQAALAQIESGQHKSRKATLEKLATAMGISLDQLR